MGPKRNIVGELEKTIRGQDMKFVTAFHHARSWFFFPVWDKRYDYSNPAYSGLYGPVHPKDEEPSKEFLDEWYGKIIEVIDKYNPEFLWFGGALNQIREDYIKKFVAYFYNKSIERDQEVLITYKDHDIPPGVAIRDLELGQQTELTYHEWITDSSVDDQGALGFFTVAGYKSVNRLVNNLIDRVSKNGYLLLNVGPKVYGTIPEAAKEKLLGMRAWLDVNGEAIYETSAWTIPGGRPNCTRCRQGR
jgi:alpha-L-fucosidase